MMKSMLDSLSPKQRRGSKPRCHWLTHGEPEAVASRLSTLIEPWAMVSAADRWMPQGFEVLEEAQLHRSPRLLEAAIGRQLLDWWLPADHPGGMTPSFDIAATCSVQGIAGLLLVEAKAHDKELIKESAGRKILSNASPGRIASHLTIKRAIEEGNADLSMTTGHSWNLSRDQCYQMSNRFAWAWKIASLGVPVVLVYLGFLNSIEMEDQGNPLKAHEDWENLVKQHSTPLFPDVIWDQRLSVNCVPLIPLIRSVGQPLQVELGS